LYYTVSGIITPIGGFSVHRLREFNFERVTISEQLTGGGREAPLLKRLQLTFTACVDSQNTSHNLQIVSSYFFSFITYLKSNLCTQL